ncbi:TPA: hypothetical protein HA225_06600 [Candidatus Micrarchaeota archaeon]|nr:hypothetical protein [Candidatus Micrarchaeota archaeon]HIH30867.1 hypothetical protein [Candidatus Micrarchaeota archaeon]
MRMAKKHQRGQYFSFDAIIASVIMVIAITSLVAYWYGAQSVVDSRTGSMYDDSMRIAESLMSPGSPSDWASLADLSNVRQIGLADDYSIRLNKSKVERLEALVPDFSAPPSPESNYVQVGRIMRSPAQYYIVIDDTATNGATMLYTMGYRYPTNATQVAIAHRGAVIDGIPVRVRVFLWRQ